MAVAACEGSDEEGQFSLVYRGFLYLLASCAPTLERYSDDERASAMAENVPEHICGVGAVKQFD